MDNQMDKNKENEMETGTHQKLGHLLARVWDGEFLVELGSAGIIQLSIQTPFGPKP